MHTDLNKMKLTLVYILALLILTFVWTELLVGQSFINWESSFDPITLPSITSKNQMSEGSSSATLSINGDVEISADNPNPAEAQLSYATDTLVTEYKLTFDGDGKSATGGIDTSYETYETFLTTAIRLTHIEYDDDVEVTLHVKASNYANDLPDAGTYTATQTLTVHWVDP
jgi:hypothetical protein